VCPGADATGLVDTVYWTGLDGGSEQAHEAMAYMLHFSGAGGPLASN